MDINGTYMGFAPTDESGVGMGELEFVINDDTITMRFATGLEIQSDEVPRAMLQRKSEKSLEEAFPHAKSIPAIYTLGQDDDAPTFVFGIAEHDYEADVVILGLFNDEIDAIFFPAHLFTPDQVAAGKYDDAIREIENEQSDPGVIPRVQNNGLRG